MKMTKRVPSVPLFVIDPHFSIWSPADRLTDCQVESWTGKVMPIQGYVTVNDISYQLIGVNKDRLPLPQTSLELTATTTTYQFENSDVRVKLSFASQFDLTDIMSLSEPLTTVTVSVEKKLEDRELQVHFEFPKEICCKEQADSFLSCKIEFAGIQSQWMGKSKQTPLNNSGDLVDVDWGYLHVASLAENQIILDFHEEKGLLVTVDCASKNSEKEFLVAYDDISAIQYFGQVKTGLWAEEERSLYDLFFKSLTTSQERKKQRDSVDQEISRRSQEIGNEEYELLTTLSYRQSIGAHKLIRDNQGELVFLSKECSSNGCIGTVDISYPSIPLYLAYQPELVNALLRPIFHFARSSVWEFPYAPHDVGRYPYATGQLYGRLNERYLGSEDTPIMYETYPAGQGIYDKQMQMPLEESGNMLIMTALAVLYGAEQSLMLANLDLLNQWADYIVVHTSEPENQLCTDDFAGHLANNVNLSLKGVIALAVYGKVLESIDQEKGKYYLQLARELATNWESRASEPTHTRLAFDQKETWSLKYNIVWDQLLTLNLFSDDLVVKELAFYQQRMNRYGMPLDSRATYTKADWLVWLASLSESKSQFLTLIRPLVRYLNESPDRVPFSDWYDSQTGRVMNFKNRSVLGAIFLPFLFQEKKSSSINPVT